MYRSDNKLLRCTLYVTTGTTLYALALLNILNLLTWFFSKGYWEL